MCRRRRSYQPRNSGSPYIGRTARRRCRNWRACWPARRRYRDCPDRSEQQPVGQLAALQTQLPLTQRRSGRAGDADRAVAAAVAVRRRRDARPRGRVAAAVRAARGVADASRRRFADAYVVPAGQVTQIAPLLPQLRGRRRRDARPAVAVSQQPVGQLVELQTQSPLTHVVPAGQFTARCRPARRSCCWSAA